MGNDNNNIHYILCIYSNLTLQWSFQELTEVLRWLYELTQADNCKDAIALAWMEVEEPEEKYKLGAIRDFYLGQFDGKIQPPVDMEKLYCEVNGLKRQDKNKVIFISFVGSLLTFIIDKLNVFFNHLLSR